MKTKKIMLTGLFALASVGLVGCSWKVETPTDTFEETTVRNEFLKKANEVVIDDTSVTFTDDSGREAITINKNPESVMNLYASFTTLWYEAGGTVDYCVGGSSAIDLYQEYIGRDITEDSTVEVVVTSSSGSKWSPEVLISKEPSLIICSTAMSGYSTISDPAFAASIPVIAVSYNDLSDYLKWFKVFSALSGKEELYNSVALHALDEVVEVIKECSSLNGPEVLSLFSGTKSFQVNTQYTLLGSMIKALGGKNIAEDCSNPTMAERLDMNLESIYAANPSMILIQCHSDDQTVSSALDSLYGDNAVWNSIDAVKNQEIYYLQKILYHNKPNSRFAEAYQNLAKILYPDQAFTF